MAQYEAIEVGKKEYEFLRKALAGLIFHRIYKGRYYVKAALKRGEIEIKKYLTTQDALFSDKLQNYLEKS